jgi:hypothetical protein
MIPKIGLATSHDPLSTALRRFHMSLRKKPTLTAKRIAASRANGRRSRGPATAEGRERIRDANTRHGFYSQEEGAALRALGEDPEEYDAMVKAVMEKYPPANAFEELLDKCLARALWGMERGHRMQEGFALRQAREMGQCRESRLHAEMMRLKIRAASLESLAQSVAGEHYVTTPADLDQVKSLRDEGAMKDLGEIAVALFYQLQEPGAPGPGESETEEDEEPEIDPVEIVNSARAIFNLGPLPPERVAAASRPSPAGPQGADATTTKEEGLDLAPEEWEGRERVRHLLKNILTRQVELCEAERVENLRECVKGPSPYERAAEIVPAHPHARLMRRLQDSNFREVWRITNLLERIKRQPWEERALGTRP